MWIWILAAIVVGLLLLGVAIIGYIAYYGILIAMEALKEREDRKSHPPKSTPLGLVSYKYDQWTTTCQYSNGDIEVVLDNIDGEPDPKAVAFLVARWKELDKLAEIARLEVPEISDEFSFDIVSSSKDGDICLGFNRELDHWGESIFVDMAGSRVVGWIKVD